MPAAALRPVGAGETMAEALEADSEISAEGLRKAEEYVQQEEGAANRLSGWAGMIVTAIAVAMTLFHLYAAYDIVPTIPLRYTHVAFVLLLSFLLFPLADRFRNRIMWFDIIPPLLGIATIVYAIMQGDDFTDRAAVPEKWDVILGAIFIVLVLEAARRTTGWIMPFVAVLFILYAYFGPEPAAAVDASRLRYLAAGRASVHHAGRHLRRSGRRVGDADHHVHDLRRHPPAFRRRQILHRFFARGHGRQAVERRPRGGGVLVSARRSVRLGRRHHGDDRHGGLADAEEGRV